MKQLYNVLKNKDQELINLNKQIEN